MEYMRDELFSQIMKDWAGQAWPGLRRDIHEPEKGVYYLTFSVPGTGWNVATIHGKGITRRARECFVPEGRVVHGDVWGYSEVVPADPRYFEKLNVIIRRSLRLTLRSIENERREMQDAQQ